MLCLLTLYLIGCEEDIQDTNVLSLDSLADEYVYLALSLGEHDPYYIDAYLGADSVRQAASKDGLSIDEIQKRLSLLKGDLMQATVEEDDQAELLELRRQRLISHTESALAFTEKLSGTSLTFEEEVERLYGHSYQVLDLSEINALIDSVDKMLPGNGSLTERWSQLRNRFRIPNQKIDTLFMKTIGTAREKTLAHINLPQTEQFRVEYVQDQPWSAYNWYKGSYYSLIQVNTDTEIFIDRPVDLAAHEGYPGHHTYQTVMEKNFIKERNWAEFSVYPLYSPTSFLSEGLAEYGINVAFPGEQRYSWERDTLLPLAGMDSTGFHLYKRVSKIVGKLDHAGLYAAAGYMNGNLDRQETEDFLVKYALMSPTKASQRVDFIDRYGAYIINYTLGSELVSDYIDKVNNSGSREGLWAAYLDILSNPYLPKNLILE
jgi:hypothetical protein